MSWWYAIFNLKLNKSMIWQIAGQGSKVRLLDGVDQINVFLRKILESGADGGVTAVRKVMDLYSSCINTARIDQLGAEPLIKLLNATGILLLSWLL